MNRPWYLVIAITLIPSLVVAVVTALLTIRLSLRKFYTERWWERKADAYSRIVEALHKHKNYDEQKLEIEMSDQEDDQNKEKKLEKQWANANAELQRAVDFGAFVISEEIEEILKKFLNRRVGDPNEDPLSEIIEKDLEQIKKCLSTVKQAAKKDLGLIGGSLPHMLSRYGVHMRQISAKLCKWIPTN